MPLIISRSAHLRLFGVGRLLSFTIKIMDSLSPSVVGLLRGMLPDGWDHFEEDSYVRCGKLSLFYSEDTVKMENKETSLLQYSSDVNTHIIHCCD